MTAKELIEQLQKVAPDTEIIGGTWNGHVDTYTVIDRVRVFLYDQVYADFFGTPGAFDDRLMKIKSKELPKRLLYRSHGSTPKKVKSLTMN